MPNPVKRGRPTVEDVLQVGRSTVGDVLQIGRNTVEEVLHVGRSTVEEVIQVGRNTVESARQLRQATMQAAVLHGRQDIRIEDVPVPRAEAGELIVRVGAALTCGTDLKVFRRGYHARMIVPPALFGHELAGTVVEAGAGVEGFSNGSRVVALNSAPCG
jgi:Alcohol dehydrogenase GroES-like domain